MPQHADCAFTVELSDSLPVDWEGGTVVRNRFAKTFTGELTGAGVVEATMFGTPDGGCAAYIGVERFEGTVGERKGSFVLLHSATMAAGTGTQTVAILAGSGTGELAGITGHADLRPDHTLTLHFDL